MKRYQPYSQEPIYESVKIADYLLGNYSPDDRKVFQDCYWGCGKCFFLFELQDTVFLRQDTDEEFFVCPNKPKWWKSSLCLEKLQGKPKSAWEKEYLING